MRCYFCGGQTEEKLVTDLYAEDELYLAVENVPADVCRQCGERYYTGEVMDRILSLTREAKEHRVPGRRAEVIVCDLAAATVP